MTKITNEIINKAIEYYSKSSSIIETTDLVNGAFGTKINPETIRRRFSKLGITRKPEDSIILGHRKRTPVKEIVRLYTDELWPIRKLSREFKVGRGTISKMLAENRIKQRNPDVDTRLSNLKYFKEKFILNPKEKAYIFGFVAGDLTPVKKSKYTLRLITHTTHYTFVKLVENVFGKHGHYKATLTKNKKCWRVVTDLDFSTFSYLLKSKEDEVPEWINESNFLYFLAGLIDADGSLILRKSGKYFQHIIRICGEDFLRLQEITKRLEKMGFHVSFYRNFNKGHERPYDNKILKYNKDYFALDVCQKKESIKLIKLLPIKHPEKLARKDLILEVYESDYVYWIDIEQKVKILLTSIKEDARSALSTMQRLTLDIPTRN